jgi:hypothetical protein
MAEFSPTVNPLAYAICYELIPKILLTFWIFINNIWISSEEKLLASPCFSYKAITLAVEKAAGILSHKENELFCIVCLW